MNTGDAVFQAMLGSWRVDFSTVAPLLLTAVLYLRGWFRVRRMAPKRFPAWRMVCFLSGLAAVFVSVASPLDAFSSLILIAHMGQHLLLTMVAAPLVLSGAPFLPLLCGLPRTVRTEWLGPFLTWHPLKRLGAVLTHPIFTWTFFITSNLLWHIPPMYERALGSETWHAVEHAMFFWSAVLFWWPVMQPWPSRPVWPRWAMIPYLLLADLQNTALAGFLTFYDAVLYPTYAAAPRLFGLSALEDQNAAGVLMWVPGSLAYFLPAGIIAARYLIGQKGVRPSELGKKAAAPRKRAGKAQADERFDLLRLPLVGPVMRWRHFRRVMQFLLFGLAGLIVLDGLRGPQVSAMNLAGVLPWTHWRGLTVIALLVAGNFFCMACPFMLVRDAGRKLLPARWEWPTFLRSKWLAVGLIAVYLWAYESFSLWDNPWATAWLIVGYFGTALVVDGFFRGASFCKYVCPIGQFHFVQALGSPMEVKVRDEEVCRTCRTADCLKGNERQRGCELGLFLPRKQGNMDCTFCLDCVKACPRDNVGILAVTPGADLWRETPRSSVGKYETRPDLAALVLVLVFGAFVNAAGMVAPMTAKLDGLAEIIGSRAGAVTLFLTLGLAVAPALGVWLCGWAGRRVATDAGKARRAFSMALAPLGIAMWVAHFVFHLVTASHTPIPVFQRLAQEVGISGLGEPNWGITSWSFEGLLAMEFLLLDAGMLFTLYALWRVANRLALPGKQLRLFLPWATLAATLYACGVWIIFQPMEMRGTMMP